MSTSNGQPAPGSGSLSELAVERALDARTREAAAEVERILDAALAVIYRVEPDSPRVADIVAEAGSSNQAFYRYFAGKDDVILAVMDRGIVRLRSYLEHQMAKEDLPELRVVRWIEAVMAQSEDSRVARESRAVSRQVYAIRSRRLAEALNIRSTLLELLINPLREAGARNPRNSADAIYDTVMGTMNRHIDELKRTSPEDLDDLVRFCLNGAEIPVPLEYEASHSRSTEQP